MRQIHLKQHGSILRRNLGTIRSFSRLQDVMNPVTGQGNCGLINKCLPGNRNSDSLLLSERTCPEHSHLDVCLGQHLRKAVEKDVHSLLLFKPANEAKQRHLGICLQPPGTKGLGQIVSCYLYLPFDLYALLWLLLV